MVVGAHPEAGPDCETEVLKFSMMILPESSDISEMVFGSSENCLDCYLSQKAININQAQLVEW